MNRTLQLILVIFSLLIIGCAAGDHQYIKINPPPFGAQFVPEQLNTILMDSGFKRIKFSARISDPGADATDALNMKTGEVLETADKYLMRYQHQTNPELLVNVIVGRDKGEVKLKFYETDRKELSAQGIDIYNKFKANLKSGIYTENDVKETSTPIPSLNF